MENTAIRMPGVIYISRATGEVTGIDWVDLDAVTVAEWGRRLCCALDTVTDRPGDPGNERKGGQTHDQIPNASGAC